jgi:hypothetical protein
MPIGLKGNTDGSGAIQIGGSDAISISTGLNTTFAGTITATGTVAGTTGTLYPLVSGTAVSATGTAVDFTGIPSWVRRITVMFSDTSLNGSSSYLIQVGAGSIATSGYVSRGVATGSGANATGSSTAGFVMVGSAAANKASGTVILNLITGNSWIATISGGLTDGSSSYANVGGGRVTLGGTLDRVRITTVNGTDTFDDGTINILYE